MCGSLRVSHTEVGVQDYAIDALATAFEKISVKGAQLIRHKPPEVASGPMYPFRYSRSRHSTSNVTCPFSSSGIVAMTEILQSFAILCWSV